MSRAMNIAFFGSSLVSSYWNGAATYYRGLLRALAARGQRITFYEPDAYDRQKHRDMADPDWAQVVVYPATDRGWQSALDAAISTADLVVKASGVGAFDAELEIAVPERARPHQITAYWDVDAPATLEAMEADPGHHLRLAVPKYDLVLTYGGGDPVVDGYRRFGARYCAPIYNALDPQSHHPVPPSTDFECTLGFVGNRLPDREARVEEFFFRPAILLSNRTFLLGGAGWDTRAVPANVRRIGHVGCRDHNAFYSSGLATLNVNRASMARYGFSPPTRIFEAAGAAACIVTDYWTGIEQFLEPGNEILVANDGAEVADLIGRLNAQRAGEIGAAARARVLAEHTYDRRARQVMQVLHGEATASEAAE
jgi:spore maturation protein CgeB